MSRDLPVLYGRDYAELRAVTCVSCSPQRAKAFDLVSNITHFVEAGVRSSSLRVKATAGMLPGEKLLDKPQIFEPKAGLLPGEKLLDKPQIFDRKTVKKVHVTYSNFRVTHSVEEFGADVIVAVGNVRVEVVMSAAGVRREVRT
ncbi:hypothetical protein Bbelb_030030 [Branchiostoma belcheri]|nr:hypothetical protein Bbelb_030030 [Branchiostoma belcheri]